MLTSAIDLDAVIDLGRYPLHAPESPQWCAAVAAARAELARDGCSVLRGFVRPDWRETLREQCGSVAQLAYGEVRTVNVYNAACDPSLPADHPARVSMERGNSFVARVDIPADHLIHQLYLDPRFQSLLAACLEVAQIHPLADPYAGLCINVVEPGRLHPWHFDTNEFAVSMITQASGDGGAFEYCPAIRSRDAENFETVAAVLAGRAAHLVRRFTLRPGDLHVFRGRYSLHRVTEVAGPTARHSAIFAYSERPDVVGTAERTRQLFGRVDTVHDANGQRRVDGLLS